MQYNILKGWGLFFTFWGLLNLFGCYEERDNEAVRSSKYIDSLLLDAVITSREKNFDVALNKLNFVIEEAKAIEDIKNQIIGNINLGNLYLYYNSEEEGLNFLFQSLDLAQEHNYEELLNSIFNNIGIVYSTNGKYELAEEYFNKALTINKKRNESDKIAINLINLGNIKDETRDFKKATEYYTQALEIFTEIKDTINISAVLNNIGNIYYNEDNFNEARTFYKEAITLIENQSVHIYLPFFKLNYGKTLYQFEEYHAALNNIQNALDSFLIYKNTDKIIECYNWLAKVQEGSENREKAIMYYNECLAWKDTLLNEKNQQWVSEMQMKYEFGKKEKQIEWLHFKASQEKRIWIGSILALLLISGLLIYSFKIKNTNLGQKNIILQKEQELARLEVSKNQLEQEKLRQEIEIKNRELASKALHLVNKNEMLNSITDILDKVNLEQETQNANLVRNAKRTIIRNINLDEQWEDFKIHFEEVHANFFRQLLEDYPTLSQTDLRFCAYLLINLDSKEIAQVSNISPDSVRKRKQRLKEKLNISKEQDLRTILVQYERA